MIKNLKASLVFTLLILCYSVSLLAQTKPTTQDVSKAVKDLVGSYSGSWTIYGLDANGQVVKQAAWTDVMKAESPIVEKNRAFVTTIDEMTFEGGRIPPMKVSGREGYMLNNDGSLGEYFIETMGQTYKMQKLAENVMAYTAPVATQEFARLGVPNALAGKHVLVKVVTFDQGVETHHISRLTTITWKDSNGQERTKQFVSLQGQHKHLSN